MDREKTVGFYQQWVAFCTLLRRETRRFLRIWLQTLVPPIITTGLYFLIFGNLIGSRIGQMAGVDYVLFVSPGLVMLTVITNAYANTSSSFFGIKFQRSIEEMLISPMTAYVMVLGFVLGGVLRGVLTGLLVWAMIAFLVGNMPVAHPWVAFSSMFLSAAMFSLLGLINGVYANNFDDISIVPTFVLTPLIYLGGVFYSTALLPPFWGAVSSLNPILYLINTFRYGVIGVSDISISASFLISGAVILASGVFVLWLITRSRRLRS